LQIPRLGALNIHHGLLPETCGTMCDLRLLLQGRRAGFSLHQMTAEVDSGALFSRVEVANAADCGKNYWAYLKLSERFEAQAVRLFLEQVVKSNSLPAALPRHDVQICWYKTPKYAEFKAWRREGWKL
jgi:methionyl-tRNA formyltransferase